MRSKLQLTKPKSKPKQKASSSSHEAELHIVIRVIVYDAQEAVSYDCKSFNDLVRLIEKNEQRKIWIDLSGKNDLEFFKKFAARLHIHDLVLEDILGTEQRSKYEEHPAFLLIISRMLYISNEDILVNEQVSFLIYPNCLITVQDELDDCFGPVREMLAKNRLDIRNENTFFLALCLHNAIVDNYFPLLDKISDNIDALEEELLTNPSSVTLNKIQESKRLLITLRKYIRPERDMTLGLLQLGDKHLSEKHKMYVRDIGDHSAQILDLVESYREISYSLMDVYLSSSSYKTNEVMRVLTVISSIFIPLTFIVGIYGMNFSYLDEEGNSKHYNMPELHYEYGYPIVMGVMLLIASLQIIWFRKKKWM